MKPDMWHEARRQERKIRTLMVDYQRRADRRRQFYEKIKMDPAQFLRIYGRPVRIHLDQSVAIAAESPQSMMPWQGSADILIDRFDVRAHLDHIPEVKSTDLQLTPDEDEEERKCNYERYRILVQNDCAGVPEEQCLQQIFVDEMYGAIDIKAKELEKQEEKKKLSSKKAAIGFVYDRDDEDEEEEEEEKKEEEENESEDSDDEMDLDAVFDYNKLTSEQIHQFNMRAMTYGMKGNDYLNNLRIDKMEADEVRMAKLIEEEKAQFSGRKSRRERRAFKEKRLRERGQMSPPSYAALDDSEKKDRESSSSRSRSRSPETKNQPVFITSFGGSDDEGVVQGPVLPPHLQSRNIKASSSSSSKLRRAESPKFTEIAPESKSFRARQNRRSSSRSNSPTHYRQHRTSPRRSSYRRYDTHSYRSHHDDRCRRRSRSRERRRSRSPRGWRARGNIRDRRSRSPRHSPPKHTSHKSQKSSSPNRRASLDRSRSKEPGRSRSRSHTGKSKSKSKSPSPDEEKSVEQPAPVFQRRSVPKSSSSDEEWDDVKKQESSRSNRSGVGSKDKSAPSKGMAASIQERMRRKMQKALNQQYKADKKALEEKQKKEELERMEREEELKAISMEMRRKEREKRHKERAELERMEDRHRNRDDSDSSTSSSDSSDDEDDEDQNINQTRSVSSSPPPGDDSYHGNQNKNSGARRPPMRMDYYD